MRTKNLSELATTEVMQKILVVLCFAGTILIICWLLRYSFYGIDFTDESYYLVWMAHPFAYDVSVSQFGFIYYPLYKLLGGNIAAIRQFNILTIFAIAWCLTYLFLTSPEVSLKQGRATILVISAAFATSALIFFQSWLPTPSYNSLNLQALMITVLGLVLAEKNNHWKSILGWLLIAVGGWLTFMAKPSSALALAICVSVYLIFSRKYSNQKIALSVVCSASLLLVSAQLIDGSTEGFIKRIQLGIEYAGLMWGGHTISTILRLDGFQLNSKFKLAISLFYGSLFLAIWSISPKNKKWCILGFTISVLFFGLAALPTLGYMDQTAEFGDFQGLLIFAVISALTTAAFILCPLQALKIITARQWALSALLLVTPHIYAFGSISNYWQVGSEAAIFWLLATFTLIRPLICMSASWFPALPVALATQALTVMLLQTGLEKPYRQVQPLRLNASTITIGANKRSSIVLSEGYAEYITTAKSTVTMAGFKPSTPMIDMTGQSPGILFFIGAESIGQAWTIGGYPGSLKLAQAALSLTSCEKISEAWILVEPDGPRSIPYELMLSLGADFPSSYSRVGTWQTAEGAGGNINRRTQNIYKPLNKYKTLITCQELRVAAK